jgi:hypothetical protein
MDFSDAEEEFYLQIYIFLSKSNPQHQFLDEWPKFLESVPKLNAANYPNMQRAIRELYSSYPKSQEELSNFISKIYALIAKFNDGNFVFTNKRREGQFQRFLHRMSEKMSYVKNLAKSNKHVGDFMERKCVCGREYGSHSSLCSKCESQHYCSKECQTSDWKRHKKECAAYCAQNEEAVSHLRQKMAEVRISGKPICTYCGKENDDLKECTRCHQAHYCNKECQVADWKAGHKQICNPEAVAAVLPTCTYCGKASENLKECAVCHRAHYCNRECQVADWKAGHKNICKKAGGRRTRKTRKK